MKQLSIIVIAVSIPLAFAGCGDLQTDSGSFSVARSAAVLEVPGDYATIGEAIAAARADDEIAVAAGEYAAGALVVSVPLTIRGDGPGLTILRGSFALGHTTGVVISDMTIRGADAGTGVDGQGSYTIERCEVTGFRTGVAAGETSGDVIVRESVIAGNVWGVDLYDADGLVVNNELVNNTMAGLVLRSFCGVRVFHNTVVGNGFSGSSDEGAGGLSLGPFGSEQARNNIVVGNAFGINCMRCRNANGHNAVWGNLENYVGDGSAAATDLALDPQFIDPAEGDFRLDAASPCIDAGTDVGVVIDAAGRSRPFGAAVDIGAYEHATALTGLVINEVMANPLVESTGEYVELYNGTAVAVDLAGLMISDGDAFDVIEGWDGGDTVVEPGEFGVILDSGYADEYDIPAAAVLLTVGDATIGNALSTSDPVVLLLSDGITEVSTFNHPFDPGNGVSAERIAPDSPDVPTMWTASPCGHSPGAENCTGGGADPEPACEATLVEECGAGLCGGYPACVDTAVAVIEAYTAGVAADGGAASWSCAEPMALGAFHTDDADALCSFDLVCTVTLDAEAGFGGLTLCNFEPGECARLSCMFAL